MMSLDTKIFTMDRMEFFADFFLVPCFIAFMMYFNTASWGVTISLLVAGALLWTLAEYIMHRFLFHGSKLFIDQHDDHHKMPKALIGNAPWMTFVSVIGIWSLIWIIAGVNMACILTSGLLIGYLTYATIHVRLHHGDPKRFNSFFAKLYQHHIAHHRGGKTNYGVTTDCWDRVFGTKAPQRG